MTKHTVPEDQDKANETPLTDDDWRKAEGAHDRFKQLLETKPRAQTRANAALAEINEGRARPNS